MRSHSNFFTGAEDMQRDTYTLVGNILTQIIEAKSRRDIKAFEVWLFELYGLAQPRMKEEERQELEAELFAIRNALTGTSERARTARELSAVYDRAEQLYWRVNRVLDKHGILYRARANYNALVDS